MRKEHRNDVICNSYTNQCRFCANSFEKQFVHTLRVCFHKLVHLVIDKQNGIRHCTTETIELQLQIDKYCTITKKSLDMVYDYLSLNQLTQSNIYKTPCLTFILDKSLSVIEENSV